MDGSLTKSLLLNRRDEPEYRAFFDLTFGKRPAEELYDLSSDPGETVNVAERPEYDAAKQKLRERLERWMRETGDPRAAQDDDRWDAFPYYGGRAKISEPSHQR